METRTTRTRRPGRLAFAAGLAAGAALAGAAHAQEGLTEDDLRWREKMGWNEQVHGSELPKGIEQILARVPYAYYPTDNELEVAFDYEAAIRPLSDKVHDQPNMKRFDAENRVKTLPDRLPDGAPPAVTVRVLEVGGGRVAASRQVPLDDKGRGYALFQLPKLAPGTYRVEFDLGGGAVIRSNRTFVRRTFEFEGNTIGMMHDVYPPFTPVEVDGPKVSVVDRTYAVNALGLFDSVVSKGRELLAEPMRLVVEAPSGDRLSWRAGPVKGRAEHPDLAVFETAAACPAFRVNSTVEVEEDGCAKVTMTWTPTGRGGTAPRVGRAWLELALKESEAPLCHLVGMNSMRHNYAGKVPRGGGVTWINQTWRPSRFEVTPFTGEAPASYEVWNATQLMHWGGGRWAFAPYVWLGAEERGLAWFADHTAGYETDGERGIQRLSIEPGKVVLRVELVQKPVALDAPRTFTFGLQASPTKPMPEGWRGYRVPGGGGMAVNVWGGYNCAWHYPDPKDWRLVEKVVSARDPEVRKNVWKGEFKAFFEEMNARRQFPERKVHGREEWLKNVLGFASRNRHPNGITVYYEEFQTSGLHPESVAYMDEWDLGSWCRFIKYNYVGKAFPDSRAWGPAARTANQRSWRDFAVYYADQWMRRGVGIYYDNTYPQVDRNRFNLRRTGTPWQNGIWGHRAYFRRVWKRSRELMAKGMTPVDPMYNDPERRLRLHIVGHVTNCQVLPYTTWWDATLGVESPGHWIPEDGPTAEDRRRQAAERGFVILPTPKKGKRGEPLPYPPDYLRAMEMGRMAGLIPHYRHLLRGEDAFGGLGISYGATDRPAEEILAHRRLSDKAMGMVHEIRGGGSSHKHANVRVLMSAFETFGYGRPEVAVHNYWADEPAVDVGDPEVKWIALEGPAEAGPAGGGLLLVLLQSYHAEAARTPVAADGYRGALDLFTRRPVPLDRPVSFPADYGTRLLLLARDEAALAPLTWPEGTAFQAQFEFGLPPAWWVRGSEAPRIVPDDADAANHVLRITPAHPSQHWMQGAIAGDGELRFRFRLPQVPDEVPYPQFYGFIQVVHHLASEWPKTTAGSLSLGVTRRPRRRRGAGRPVRRPAGRRGGGREGHRRQPARRGRRPGAPGHGVARGGPRHRRSERRRLSVDGHLLLDAVFEAAPDGKLRVGAGWGSWDGGVPYVEIDDLRYRRKQR